MKKLNLICAAITLVTGVANAGTLTPTTAGGTRFAAEAWGGSTTATTPITPEAITYSVGTTNGIVVNSGGKLYVTIRLTGATFAAAPAASTISGSIVTLAGGAAQVGAGTLSSDSATVVYPITFTSNQNIGVGATVIYTPAAGNIVGAKGTLSNAGGAVTAAVGLSALTSSATPGTTVPADVDGPAPASAAIAQSVNGVTITTSTSGLTSQINVGASPANTTYIQGTTSGLTTAQLGRIKIAVPTDSNSAPLPALSLDGATAYTVANYLGGTGGQLGITLTPNAGGAFASVATNGSATGTQAKVFLVSGTTNCGGTAVTGGASAALSPTDAAAAVTLTIAGSNVPAAGADGSVNLLVCQGTSVTASSGAAAISPVTPTIAITATPTTALGALSKTFSGTGYALTYNGAVVTTVGYWPAALSQFGYTTFTRVINTGSTPTAISAAFITQTTGVAGASQVLPLPAGYGATLAPGASVTWTNAAVESVLGTIARDDRPTLRITGQTSNLKVQQFVQSPNGTFNEVSGSQQ